MVLTASIFVLAFAFLAQVFSFFRKREAAKFFRFVFLVSVVLVLAYFVYLVFAQYILWRDSGPPSSFFVPPYRSPLYVINYHFIRFGIYYLISFAAAFAFLFGTKYLNKKFDERFFEKEEPYLGALSIFLLGHPQLGYAWIYYLGAILATSVILSFVRGHFTKRSERFSLRFLWLPIAVLVMLIQGFL